MFRFYHIIFISIVVLISQVQAFEPKIEPRYDTISFPTTGFTKLDDEAVADSIDLKSWQIGNSNGYNLFLLSNLHSGSGRGWTITIGVSNSDSVSPDYGVILSTSTIGWRTLKKFENKMLPWIEDIDGDSNDDIIIWDSFLAFESGTNADFGLIAWVYSLDQNGYLVLNMNSTSLLLERIATEYDKNLPNNPYLKMKRDTISQIIREYMAESVNIKKMN